MSFLVVVFLRSYLTIQLLHIAQPAGERMLMLEGRRATMHLTLPTAAAAQQLLACVAAATTIGEIRERAARCRSFGAPQLPSLFHSVLTERRHVVMRM
jgi:hypothetical protein